MSVLAYWEFVYIKQLTACRASLPLGNLTIFRWSASISTGAISVLNGKVAEVRVV